MMNLHSKIKRDLVLSVSIFMLFFFPLSLVAQTDISTSMCRSYMAVVHRAVDLGKQGIPINTAQSMAESALNTNPQLWRFLISAINMAYKDPQFILGALNDGSLIEMCAKQVRGN